MTRPPGSLRVAEAATRSRTVARRWRTTSATTVRYPAGSSAEGSPRTQGRSPPAPERHRTRRSGPYPYPPPLLPAPWRVESRPSGLRMRRIGNVSEYGPSRPGSLRLGRRPKGPCREFAGHEILDLGPVRGRSGDRDRDGAVRQRGIRDVARGLSLARRYRNRHRGCRRAGPRHEVALRLAGLLGGHAARRGLRPLFRAGPFHRAGRTERGLRSRRGRAGRPSRSGDRFAPPRR